MRLVVRWAVWIIIVLLVLLLGIQFILTPWLEQKAYVSLNKQHNDQFRTEVKAIHISPFTASIRLDSINIFLLKPSEGDKSNVAHEYRMHSTKLELENVSIWQYIFNNKLWIGRLQLSKPDFVVCKQKHDQITDKDAATQNFGLNNIKIEDYAIDSISFTYTDSIEHSLLKAAIQHMSGGLSLSQEMDSKIEFQPDETTLQLTNASASLPGGYYDIRLDRLLLSGNDSLLQLDSFMLIPLLEKYEFSQKYGYRTDRVVANIQEIKCAGLDLYTLTSKGLVIADLFTLSGVDASIFRDARLPFKPGKFTVLLQKKLRKLPFTFTVDSTLCQNTVIRYEEKRLDDQSTGHLILEDVNISGGKLTNDSVLMEQTIYAPEGTAIFMGEGQLKAEFHFPLSEINGHHRVSGHLGPMPIVKVNPILYPLTTFRIESGVNDNVYFNMAVDERDASGDMNFYYHDLKIKMGTEKEQWLNDIGSFFANQLIRSENPMNGKFKEGVIYYERDTKRSIYNYWWKALRSGLITSVGLSPDIVE